ncbi:uncharacterized protein RJT20DRAFT_29981 [Scheffersomyces xylosifermentans]|uniref:uncharacterized protein n=1 Tax=Scheffersomyces xylosifermentans TaxID=1304137 RepID=UPI00315DADE0
MYALAPTSSKENFGISGSNQIDTLTFPYALKSVPLHILVDLYDSENGYDVESIASEIHPNDSEVSLVTEEDEDLLNRSDNSSRLTELGSLFPTLCKSDSPTNILSSYFSNELFYAQQLVDLPMNFLNYEFKTFSNKLILHPNPVSDKIDRDILISISQYADQITDIVNKFNLEVTELFDTVQVDMDSLVEFKRVCKTLIRKYLETGLHSVIDNLIDLLYDYNGLFDNDCSDTSITHEQDAWVTTVYSKIEAQLTLKSSLTCKDVGYFMKELHYRIISNAEWRLFLQKLQMDIK